VILPTATAVPPAETGAAPTPGVPLEAVVGGLLLLLVVVYVALYWRGLAAVDRYAGGFVLQACPVCKVGHLSVETRQSRILGIPRPRSTVRCDNCKSVLREAGERRWRYAVDRAANPGAYQRWNGRVIEEEALSTLLEQPIQPPDVRPPGTPPTFVDDERR
jgi:hypothetical protein